MNLVRTVGIASLCALTGCGGGGGSASVNPVTPAPTATPAVQATQIRIVKSKLWSCRTRGARDDARERDRRRRATSCRTMRDGDPSKSSG